jgi:hypothetical protein
MAPELTNESIKALTYIAKNSLLQARFTIMHNTYAAVCSEGKQWLECINSKREINHF